MAKTQLTQAGYDKLVAELTELKEHKRPEAVEQLETARRKGDLSENSEYTAAKEALAFVHGRIQELEFILGNAEVFNSSTDGGIQIGSEILVQKDGKEETLFIVGEFESDPMNKKLSATSPIGKALLGKKVGESVEVQVPAGTLTYTVLKVK
ncbi:transcription elongation factor GreA [Candidatus Woesebacteria bacterium]|nr:transcription elongation factor GreA [Candidatus Woesebacteria bacterium]